MDRRTPVAGRCLRSSSRMTSQRGSVFIAALSFTKSLFTVSFPCAAHCEDSHTCYESHTLTMEVQEPESLGRWDGLGSRDALSRVEAMENIQQVVLMKVEAIKPIPSSSSPSPPASGSPPGSDLNDILAHLLMLSRRCPFEDVRDGSSRLLQSVQVGVRALPHAAVVELN